MLKIKEDWLLYVGFNLHLFLKLCFSAFLQMVHHWHTILFLLDCQQLCLQGKVINVQSCLIHLCVYVSGFRPFGDIGITNYRCFGTKSIQNPFRTFTYD